MNKELLTWLLPTVNDPATRESLEKYAEYRIGILQTTLETSNSIETVYRTQGAIQELRRIFTLRDEVNQRKKDHVT